MSGNRSIDAEAGRPAGVLAEFKSDGQLIEAARRVRDAGYRRWDCHTPYPVHGLDAAMGIKHTVLPWFVAAAGLTGASVGLLLQWWTNTVDYPFIISGKPLWSLPAHVPVIFELTVLFAAFASFFGMLALNGLPRFYRPVFRSERFRRATQDRFFIFVEESDAQFDGVRTTELLISAGSTNVEVLEE